MIRRLRRLSLSALCCVLLLSACATLRQGPVDADPLRLAPRTLDGQGRIGRLTYQGALVLSGGTARFGGFSVLHVDAGGEGVIAISDRGAVLRGRLRHDAEGRLTGFAVDRLDPLPGADGKPVRGEWSDAESLAPLPDGRFAVGFEHRARIGLYDSGFARPPTELPLPNGIEVEPNQGLETMAALADGRLLLVVEADGATDPTLHQAWLGGAGGWDRLSYRAEAGFKPVDATRLPDGDILVLERRDPILLTMGGRIVRLRAADIRPGAVLAGEELARLNGPDLGENFEGIAAWRDADRALRIAIISDNNFLMLLRTVLAEFTLDPG